MRCFIAIDIPSGVKEQIVGVIEKVGSKPKGIRWVAAENIHLTLKFLGEVKDDLIPDIGKKLLAVCANHNTFTVTIRGTGVFPNLKHPNIMWIGIDESKSLEALFLSIEEAMSEFGFEKEDRKFSPHLTIGRVKDRKGIGPVVEEFNTFSNTSFGSVEVNEVLLMKSVLKSSGAEYSKVAVFKLSR